MQENAPTWGDGNQSQKRDAGKPKMSLLPFLPLVCVVRSLEFGLWKYRKINAWKDVEGGEERYRDALLRHALAYGDGIRTDEESGLPTLAHLACDVLFSLWFTIKTDPGRPWLSKKRTKKWTARAHST